MAKHDVLDKTMAQQFAWRIAKPADFQEAAVKPPPPPATTAPAAATDDDDDPSSKDSEAEEQRMEDAVREREELAKQTARVWQITSPSLQAEETLGLLRRVQTISLYIAGMNNHPRESILLWRLVVRHYETLSASDYGDEIHTLSFMPVDTSLRETVELLIDVAEKGDPTLAFMMGIGEVATEAAGRRHPELGRRLARILDDETKPWASREIAAEWLSLAEARVAVPSLRRALFLPHARIRTAALETLLEMEPPQVTEADVLWLLEDAVKHPLPIGPGSSAYETAYNYANTLVVAVTKRPPPEGFRPLEAILNGHSAYPIKHKPGLDDAWALRALAAGYPERALMRIDHLLYGNKWWHRNDAIAAVELLPDELARPRLLEAAARSGHMPAEKAKTLWFERFGEACPVTELAGVDVEILTAPPSERFLSCLSVLRGSSDEAKATMLKALVAEAKAGEASEATGASETREGSAPPEDLSASERETLALLLFTQTDLSHGHADLPSSEQDWAKLLFRRFGEPAFAGLLRIAALGAYAGRDHEGLGALATLAREGVLSPSQRDRLRDAASEALCSPAWDGATSPLIALNQVGAPSHLLDRLWSIAMAEVPEAMKSRRLFGFASFWAGDVLVKMKDTPALDARLAEEGEKAQRARNYEKLERIVVIGGRRRVPSVLEIAASCIESLDEDPAARDAAVHCVHSLNEAKRIDEAWVLDRLRKPESLRFDVAAVIVRMWTSAETIAALESALESTARGGAAAAVAAETLVAMKEIEPVDARLEGILNRAPPRERASLAGMLLRSDAPLSGLRHHIVELLVEGDEETAKALLRDVDLDLEGDETKELFESVLSRSPSALIREEIEHLLEKPTEADLYFQDDDEEAGDEEDG